MSKGSPQKADFELLFNASPALYLALAADSNFTIIGVTDAYIRATMTNRDQIMGRGLFEVFPDNPEDPLATGTRNLRASLERVIQSRLPDRMPLQRYDIPRPEQEDAGFEIRFWNPLNTPVLDPRGEVVAILHEVQDATEGVRGILRVEESNDVVTVRERTDQLARSLRFNEFERKAIVTAASELARNVRVHAKGGRVTFVLLHDLGRLGLEITFEDLGKGIRDLKRALMGGYSSTGTLGLGLSGSSRLADEFQISTIPGKGTQITIRKWTRPVVAYRSTA